MESSRELNDLSLCGSDIEKLNISFVTEDHNSGLPTAEEREAVRKAQEEHKQYLSIPRRLVLCYSSLTCYN